MSKPSGVRRGSSSSEVAVASQPPPPEMKSLFKSKPRTPADIVRQTTHLLQFLDTTKRHDNDKVYLIICAISTNVSDLFLMIYYIYISCIHVCMCACMYLIIINKLQMSELSKNIRELKQILYGDSESEPVSEACAQLTQEFFKDDTLRLLINCLPKLNLEVITYFIN